MALPTLRDADLCTLADVARRVAFDLTVPTPDPDTVQRIVDAIASASNLIASYCGRSFERVAAQSEQVAGYGTLELCVQERLPINTLMSVSFDGAAVDPSTYECLGQQKRIGVITLFAGALWTAGLDDGGVGRNRVVGHERLRYTVVYDGGYQTPTQAPVAGVSVLPPEIARAAYTAAVYFFLTDGSDPTLTSERLQSYGYSRDLEKNLGTSGLPKQSEAMLGNYMIVPQA